MNEDEKKLEEEALAKIDQEALRTEIISDFGFDEVDDAERIEKALAREVKSRTVAAKAIGAKIKVREDFEAFKKTVPPPQDNKVTPDVDIDKKLDEKVNERLEKRDLESMDYPDELKDEIQRVAKITGVSVKQAAKDPYIVNKINDYEKEDKINQATISRNNKTGSKKTYSIDSPPKVDMNTAEGQKEWNDWKAKMKEEGR